MPSELSNLPVPLIHWTMCYLGDQPFDFTALLHTYFRLPDINKTTVDGLKGCAYFDKVNISPAAFYLSVVRLLQLKLHLQQCHPDSNTSF